MSTPARTAAKAPAPETLGSIQLLRGLAALAVAVAHLHAVENRLAGEQLLGAWALAGFGGVDLFFVISGFVMVWTTRDRQGQATAVPGFAFARAARIYPLWWLVCGALVAVWLVRPEWVYASHHTQAPDILRSLLLLPAPTLPLHAVGWTLIHELWFYLVFAALLLAPTRWFPGLLGLWALVVAGAALAFPAPQSPLLALVRHPLTLEFILGAGVGLLASRGVWPAPRLLVQAGLIWMLLAAISARSDAASLFAGEWWRVVAFGVPSALLVWGLAGLEQAGWRAPRFGVRLGDWSYALYLIHVPVFAALGRLAAPVSSESIADSLILLPVALAAAIAAAALLHVGFERPVQKAAGRVRRSLDRAAGARL